MKNYNIKNMEELSKDLNVFYIEDDDTLRTRMVFMLEEIFNSVTTAHDGIEALRKYESAVKEDKVYDIIFTDIIMPKMDGITLSKKILEINPLQQIVAISAHNESEKLESLIDIGITNYIKKPITNDRLFQVIYKTSLLVCNVKEQEINLLNLKQKAMIYQNIDQLTQLKNIDQLHFDIKNNLYRGLILFNLTNINTLETIHSTEYTDNLIKNFADQLQKHVSNPKNLYKKNSNVFAYLIDNDTEIDSIILKSTDICNQIGFDIVSSASYNEKSLISTAKMALSFAISHGMDFKIYSDDIDKTKVYQNHIRFQKIIDDAIETDDVYPVFQPIYNKDKEITKYEVLMRLSHTSKGINCVYYPYQFMDISMDSYRFVTLSKIVIKKAFAQMKNSSKKFSINISYDDIIHNTLLDYIEEQIKKHEGIGERIVLEILETKGIESYEVIESFLNRFKKYGVETALDDFGAGYSNLNHIVSFQSEYVKLDAVLIKNILNDKKSASIVKSVIQFTKELGIKTIAEYVSSKEIFDFVKVLGVDEFQGFYLSKPLKSIPE